MVLTFENTVTALNSLVHTEKCTTMTWKNENRYKYNKITRLAENMPNGYGCKLAISQRKNRGVDIIGEIRKNRMRRSLNTKAKFTHSSPYIPYHILLRNILLKVYMISNLHKTLPLYLTAIYKCSPRTRVYMIDLGFSKKIPYFLVFLPNLVLIVFRVFESLLHPRYALV